jgi:hypothetical protein
MLKLLSICAMFIALAMAPASAQQEAILRKVEVTGAGFDIVLAMSKPGGTTYDLAKSPEALLIHLIGGQLVLGFDAPEKMLAALESVRSPVCTFHIESKGDTSPGSPVAVFVTRKGEELETGHRTKPNG